MKKLLFLFIFIFLLAISVSAVPPFQASDAGVGLTVEVPVAEYVEQNLDVKLHTHVFNSSNGLTITNTTASCFVHLYNNSGSHILEADMGFDSNGLEFKLDIAGGNFSKVAMMGYIIACNTSSVGGFVRGGFEVTETGKVESNLDSSSGLALVIFMLFATSLFFILPFVKKPLAGNEFLDIILRRGCWIIAIFLMSLNSAMVATIAAKSFLPLTGEFLFGYMWIFNWGGYLLMFFTFIKTIIDMVSLRKFKDNQERFGEDD